MFVIILPVSIIIPFAMGIIVAKKKNFLVVYSLWRQIMNDASYKYKKKQNNKTFLWNVHWRCPLFCIRLPHTCTSNTMYNRRRVGCVVCVCVFEQCPYDNNTLLFMLQNNGKIWFLQMIWHRFMLLLTFHHLNGVKCWAWELDLDLIQLSSAFSCMWEISCEYFSRFYANEPDFQISYRFLPIPCPTIAHFVCIWFSIGTCCKHEQADYSHLMQRHTVELCHDLLLFFAKQAKNRSCYMKRIPTLARTSTINGTLHSMAFGFLLLFF